MKIIDKEYIEEFNKLKHWVSNFPIEAVMRIEELEKENANREESHIQLYHRMSVAEDKAQNLEEENKKLIEILSDCRIVLQYYANDENYVYQASEVKWGESFRSFNQSEMEKDRGERARKLLSKER